MSSPRPLVLTSICLAFLSCAACKPAATGPFSAILALERWQRTDPQTKFTGTGLITFRRDERMPRWIDVDANCKAHLGNWTETPERPPSFGQTTMNIADRKQVPFTEDSEGAGYENGGGGFEWDSGDRLEVTAAGDEAPGFSVSATVPAKVRLESPDLANASTNSIRIARDEPLELRWAPATGDVLLLFLQFPKLNSIPKEVGLWCVFPAAPGEATVPTSTLSYLLPSTNDRASNIYFGGVERQFLALEGLDLNVLTFHNDCARIQVQ